MEQCRFFDPKAGACGFQAEMGAALSPYNEQLRRMFRRGADVGSYILLLDRASNYRPSLAKWEGMQHNGYWGCEASTHVGYGDYDPDPVRQFDCDRYVTQGDIIVTELIQRARILPEAQVKLLPAPEQ